MDIWFVKNKAFFSAEEIIAFLYDWTSTIKLNVGKVYTEAEVRAISDEFFNLIKVKISNLNKEFKYRDQEFIDYFVYAMVALIDDVFLSMSWSGRTFWSTYLLESRFFSTRAAGDIFFENSPKILKQRDPKYKELAAVYHLCLDAGFRGKYLHTAYNEEINATKTDLYNFFTEDEPDLKVLINQAVLPSGNIVNKSKSILMRTYLIFNRLLLVNFAFLILFIIASYFVWFHNENLIFRNL